jgi:hypothetical protein
MSNNVELLKRLYERFNARDIEAVLAAMHEDVIWANGMEGGYLHGREGVCHYWTRQWAIIDPHVEPIGFSPGPNEEMIVDVHQTVHDLMGNLLSDHRVDHIYRIEDGLITQFDLRTR